MRILAIDPGSSCGFAIGGPSGVDTSGTWSLSPGRGESPGMRYVRLRGQLEETLRAFSDLGLVVYEQAHHRGGSATEYAAGCAATIQAWAAERGIEHAVIHSATLKRWATGRGNANKAEMVAAGRTRFTPTGTTDDEMDALWLFDYARSQYIVPAAVSASLT